MPILIETRSEIIWRRNTLSSCWPDLNRIYDRHIRLPYPYLDFASPYPISTLPLTTSIRNIPLSHFVSVPVRPTFRPTVLLPSHTNTCHETWNDLCGGGAGVLHCRSWNLHMKLYDYIGLCTRARREL